MDKPNWPVKVETGMETTTTNWPIKVETGIDTTNWPIKVETGAGDSTMESVDWRSQLPPDGRQKILNKIIGTLKKQPSCEPHKPHEIESIALRFEDKIYTTATTQSEYVRKISVKLLNMESMSANSNSTSSSVNPSDTGSQGMQQVKKEGQPLPINVPSNHPKILSPALPPCNGLSQSNVTTQNHNIQNMSRVQVQQNSIGNSFVNQRQIPGKQQSQNSQQFFSRHQLYQIAKHNLQQNFTATSHIQQQHQNLLQPGHFQSSSLSSSQQSQPMIQNHQRQQRQQPQQQQQQRVVSQQNNLSNVQQPHQHSLSQHVNNFTAMNQQHHLGPQSLLVTQQHSTQMVQSKVSIPHQNQSMKPELQQKVIPQLNMKPQSNMSQREMQQRIPIQQQNVIIDQQKQQLFQQQRAMPEASSTSSDSTAQTGNPNNGDWQEEVYQKIKAMKDKYMPDLKDLYNKIASKLHQFNSLPQQPKTEQIEKMKQLKQAIEHWIQFLQVPKTKISLNYKEKLSLFEKSIVNIITTYNRKPGPTPQQPQPNSTMFQLHMQQQFLQKQQLLQQQQQKNHQQQQQLNRYNTVTKQQLQVVQQQLPHGKMESSSLQRLKPGPPFSPNVDQQLTSVTLSSPSTPSTSHVVGDCEKVVNSGVCVSSQVTNQSNVAMLPPTPIATPGISASPLLAEFASPDENQGNDASVVVSGKSSTIEQPIEHLLKVVKSISAKSLSASVSDIGSVVSMIDSIAGSGNASRGTIGEDLVATTKSRLEGKISTTNGTRKMKRLLTSSMHLNVVSSASSVNNSFMHLNGLEGSELESTATSTIKRPRIETRNALLEEIRGINRGLIDTMLDIDADSDVGKGTVVKCSFGAVSLGPNFKSQYTSSKLSPIQPLRLLVPENYPNCSPVLLDKFAVEVSKEYEDLSIKAKRRFCSHMRMLSEPMSLEDMARSWDVCARAVISEYAHQSGGGTFTSKYGAWEDCLPQ